MSSSYIQELLLCYIAYLLSIFLCQSLCLFICLIDCLFTYIFFCYLGGAVKKNSFISDPYLIPSPSSLVATFLLKIFFELLKKSSVFLVARPFPPPPPLSGRATKKITFLRLPLFDLFRQFVLVYQWRHFFYILSLLQPFGGTFWWNIPDLYHGSSKAFYKLLTLFLSAFLNGHSYGGGVTSPQTDSISIIYMNNVHKLPLHIIFLNQFWGC